MSALPAVTPTRHRILLVSGASKDLRNVARVLRTIVSDVEVSDALPEADLSGFDLLLIDLDGLTPEQRQPLIERAAEGRLPSSVLLLHARDSRAELSSLFSSGIATNLVARNEGIEADELIVTIRKLLERDVFGLEKYLNWGIEPIQFQVRTSEEKAQALEAAHQFARQIGIGARLCDHFRDVADEFLTSALDQAGGDNGAAVVLRIGCDGRRLGVSVCDDVGALTASRLLEYLSRCFKAPEDELHTDSGRAALSYFFAFQWVRQLVVNIEPGRRAELIGLIDVRRRYRDFAKMRKSFNVFLARP